MNTSALVNTDHSLGGQLPVCPSSGHNPLGARLAGWKRSKMEDLIYDVAIFCACKRERKLVHVEMQIPKHPQQ